MRLVLASASPRRKELLAGIGWDPEVCPADLDESPLDGETPEATVLRLARAKARHVAETIVGDALVLGADTVVVVEGQVLGKPGDAGELRSMILRLAGRAHEVLTGVCLVDRAPRAESSGVARTEVLFSAMSAAEIDWYVATGEGRDKAGGYGVQGLAALFIPEIRGSWSNVVGLPLELVYRLALVIGRDLRAGS